MKKHVAARCSRALGTLAERSDKAFIDRSSLMRSPSKPICLRSLAR